MLELPVLPLRDTVAFPHAMRPFSVGRDRSSRLIAALSESSGSDTDPAQLVLALQRNPEEEDPSFAGLHQVGTLGRLIQVARPRPDRPGMLALIVPLQRVRLLSELQREPFMRVKVRPVEDLAPQPEDAEYQALRDGLRSLFTGHLQRSPHVSNDLLSVVGDVDDAGALADVVAAALPGLSIETRQELLATFDVRQRLRRLTEELVKANHRLEIEEKIQADVREKVAGTNREIFLREQLQAIRRELGEGEDDLPDDEELREQIEAAGMSEEAKKEAQRELRRLKQIPTGSPEQTVTRNYLDWLIALPWTRSSAVEVDIARAERILEEDHYGLEKIKERVLEYLAVMKLHQSGQGQMKGPILCFAGPPGVGKTSLGRSIARALGRAFAHVSLGGVHDEGELRGHRRTYVGAMPGQIMQALRRAGSNDPVFMLDEVDKLGRDFRGDPAAALLEILDPEQNNSFRDHYLDVPFDLSRVLFIGTANLLDPIPPPLLDRMEVLELSGYSDEEKLHIARRYLVPKKIRENALPAEGQVEFADAALLELARLYTHEAGVRGLEREIGSICRKQARRIAGEGAGRLEVTPEVIRRELGPPRFLIETEVARRTEKPGVAVGLAWTPHGGDILFVEANRTPGGEGEFTLTGQLGDVMKESARAALTWLHANASRFGIDPQLFKQSDLHVHVPAGAVPKDGPSAGLVIVAALASALTGRRVRSDMALTGEVTLSGHVLPVGGVREKALAARRSGIHKVILPELNRANVAQDLPPELRADMSFSHVQRMEEALEQVLEPGDQAPAEEDGQDDAAGTPAHH